MIKELLKDRKNNALHLFIMSMLLLLCTNFAKAQTPFEGEGTSENPYKIYTAVDFGRIRDYQDSHFEIMNDIDMYDYLVENFGEQGWQSIQEFSGEINGNGFLVSGFYANREDRYTGIFNKITYATIKNIGIEYVEDIIIRGGTLFIGSADNSDVKGCFIKAKSISFGNLSNSSIWFGGLITTAYTCTISDNYVVFDEVTCNAYGDMGGLCGNANSCTIVGNSVKGDILGYGTTSNLTWHTGGLIGHLGCVVANNKVSNNKYEGNVLGKKRVGGLYGETSDEITVTSNLVIGNVYGEGSYRTGGLCASVYSKTTEITKNVLIIDTIAGGERTGYIAAYYTNYGNNVHTNKRLVTTVKTGGYTDYGPKEEAVTVGKTLLMTKSTYSDMGWDFDNYWEIEEGKTYPYLKIERQWLSKLDSNTPINPDENIVDTDISTLPNTTYISNFEVNSGRNATMSLKLKNSTIDATGFQCDIYLPNGCSFLQDSDGFYLASLSTERTTAAKTNYFDCSLQGDGALRILCNSTKGYAFSGTDGEVVTIDIAVPVDLKDGIYPIYIKNIRITEATGSADLGAKVESIKLSMAVSSYELGDANGDGEISVNDFSAVANCILGNMADGFIEKAADVNKDEEVTVNDLSGIAYYILNGQFPWITNKARSSLSTTRQSDNLTNKLYVSPFTIQRGETTATLSLNMLNDIAATGFQCDIYLPDGFSFAKDADDFYLTELSTERTTPRKTNYFDCALQADGSLRILCNSTGGYAFEGSDGEVAKIVINIDSNVSDGVYKVIVRKGELADKTGSNGIKIEEDVTSDITYGNPIVADICNIQVSSRIATYCSTIDLNFTNVAGLKAYIASGCDKSTGRLMMSRVYDVPAGTGLLLIGEVGNYKVPVAISASYYSNMLKGVTTATTISPNANGYDNYILANGINGIGFYPVGEEGTLDAGKAYLQLPESVSVAKSIGIQFDETTDIKTNYDSGNINYGNAVYNLMGQKVKVPTMGLHIINGKKVVVK